MCKSARHDTMEKNAATEAYNAMLFVLFALTLIGLMLFLIDPKSGTMRWISAVAFTGAFGALAAVLSDDIIPYLQNAAMNPTLIGVFYHIQAACSLLSYYGLPYAFAMLALRYNSAWTNDSTRFYLPVILLLPALACLLFTPGYNEVTPITFPVVASWAVPYIIGGAILIAIKKERLPAMRRTHLFTCLSVLPPVICFAVLNYVMPSLGYYRMWVYHTWILAIVIPFFMYTLFTYGILGIRLMIERRKLDSTLRAITSGTAILNHAIKNDVGKMRLFLEKMQQYAIETNQQELLQDLGVVMKASGHIREMIGRVHEQTQELPIQATLVPLGELLQEVIPALEPFLSGIRLHMNVPESLVLNVDRIQMTETLTNVLMNAVEAMPRGGELTVKTFFNKKNVVLEVRDTGGGMDKATLKLALEPFYTTKSGGRSNFGLGLAYCYSVMKKHGGMLELASRPGEGTSVYLTFPGYRLQP
ncbi:sensor histidine kinase [Paenibacillus aestuarii]|uniref:histidine kinase n=1 Tax=Paenibacillus aestuarii TaxID=516965 RepID=A0ABW0K3R5_9BACL|nr:HAMP domain-containing sensor histidine kinase [Paenibacillus aestuarii]